MPGSWMAVASLVAGWFLVGPVLASPSGVAKVATIDLLELSKLSSLVVVGKVRKVEKVGGVQVAFVETLSRVKGVEPVTIAFVAQPTWTCDISKAINGERALLYLSEIRGNRVPATMGLDVSAAARECRRRGATLYALSHSGRGRIPLSQTARGWVAWVQTGPKTRPQLNVDLDLPSGFRPAKDAEGRQYATEMQLVKVTLAATP